MRCALFALLFATGCPVPSVTDSTTLQWPAGACADGGVMSVAPTPCNKWTSTGKFFCAQCQGEAGCVDTRMMIMCVSNCSDSLCGAP